jgi:hypothetical protein
MKLASQLPAALFLALCVSGSLAADRVEGDTPDARSAAPQLPDAWQAGWKSPATADRPMQIVHGIVLPARSGDQKKPMSESERKQLAEQAMTAQRNRGLGGVVCNVSFQNYLTSEENWKTLAAGVEACHKLGMVVWLYDEKGYPSGAAGGLVLKDNPAFEALEMAMDRSRPDPFVLRPSFEFTHASNNYAACQRYVNLLDAEADRAFIAKTHEAYRQRLSSYFGNTIQAFFTDEPSLMAVNLGQIPEPARKRVPVTDPIDPKAKSLPAVPWSRDLVEQYRQRFHDDLMAKRSSLFGGQTPGDLQTRRQFWSLVAELLSARYYGEIQTWCHRNGVASSGHILHEESILHHPALEGNSLQDLMRMDIPGCDVLSSNPENVMHGSWMTAALPSSAAVLNGGRRVMTEVSDFGEVMSGQGPAKLDMMRATAAWQAAWGVTEFTLYYSPQGRPETDYPAYGDFVGRLNAILKPARIERETLLYYPIYDLWAEYLPTAEPLGLGSQSARAQKIVQSFWRLGTALQRNQIPFVLVDHELLAKAKPQADGSLLLAGRRFSGLVVPDGVAMPEPAAKVEAAFRAQHGRVFRDDAKLPADRQRLLAALRPAYRLEPAQETITLGSFRRDDRPVALLAQAGASAYQGLLSVPKRGTWSILDPASGAIASVETNAKGQIAVSLAGRQTLILVGSR